MTAIIIDISRLQTFNAVIEKVGNAGRNLKLVELTSDRKIYAGIDAESFQQLVSC